MKPRILVFTLEGCPACAMLKPLAERLKEHYASCIDTQMIDVTHDDSMAQMLGVEEVPTMLAYAADGSPLARMAGYAGNAERAVKLYNAALYTAVSCDVPPFKEV